MNPPLHFPPAWRHPAATTPGSAGFRARRLVTMLMLASMAFSQASAEKRVAFLGDSITYHGGWAVRVESALRSSPEFAEAEIVNLGLSSETVSGLSEAGHADGRFPRPDLHERLGRVLAAFKPTHVIACYGMNDGIYLPPDAGRLAAFQDGIKRLKSGVEAQGAVATFITPPLHQADKASDDPLRYDRVLDQYAEWLLSRRADGWQVIDIRVPLREGIAEAKRKNPGWVYAADGVHPADPGHRMIGDAVSAGLWETWGLSGIPNPADDAAMEPLVKRHHLLRNAWLSATGHLRPGIPAGTPLDEARVQADALLDTYRRAAAPEVSAWNGFERLDFTIGGRAALVVRPKTAATGHPWIWRTEFFGHEPQADVALLGEGFHVAYIDMRNLYGSPAAMRIMDAFHRHLAARFSLSQKPVLVGFSRGGLFAFNWAARCPDRVSALYVDAPVCDFKSWPGGKGSGPGSPADWKRLLEVYCFTEAEALSYGKNPVDNLEPLARAGLPIIAVIGEADEVVPVAENIDLVEERYRKLGGSITVIRKPGGKHHPHSLRDPAPIVDFIRSSTR